MLENRYMKEKWAPFNKGTLFTHKMAVHSVFLPGKFHGQRNLAG